MYTEEFKRKVVLAHQNGESIGSLRAKYGISGSSTIQRWVQAYQGKEVRLQNPTHEPPARLDAEAQAQALLKEQCEELKSALSDAQLRILYLETLLDLGREMYGIDLRKKFIGRQKKR